MNKEEWRAVPGYENFYEVSSLGNVRSIYRYKKQLKPCLTNAGYFRVELFKDKSGHWFSVHRLVASAFIDNPLNKPEVNHKDECKTNNCVNNLEWVTRKENVNYGTGIQRRLSNTDYSKIERHPENQIKAVSIPIAQYSLDGTFIKTWKSASEFCRANGKNTVSPIRRCCSGERKTAYGFIFKDLERRNDLSHA